MIEPDFFSSTWQEGAFALVFKSVHYPGEAIGTRYASSDAEMPLVSADWSIFGWWKCCSVGGEVHCWWEWGATTSCPQITSLWSTAPVSLNLWFECDLYLLLRYVYFTKFFPAAKEMKGCSTLPRVNQDTCLFPVDEKAVEYYFASDARYTRHIPVISSTFYSIPCVSSCNSNMWWCFWCLFVTVQ